MLAEHLENVEKRLKEGRPLLSRVDSWLKRQLKAAREEYIEANRWRPHQEAISRCKAAQLEQSAYFLTKDLAFRKDREPILKKELKKLCKVPAKEFKFKTRIWMPKNWIVTQHFGKEARIVSTEVQKQYGDEMTYRKTEENELKWPKETVGITDDALSYSVCKHQIYTTNSAIFGWRWINFFRFAFYNQNRSKIDEK